MDDEGRIQANQVPELDNRSILILQAGNVNSGSFDDLATLCQQAQTANAWVHIDGAFSLWAAGSNKLKHLTSGIEQANSFSVDGHKTLNTPYDNGIILCSDSEALVNALQASGNYTVYSDNRDGMLHTPEMSRRARVVELWATLNTLENPELMSLSMVYIPKQYCSANNLEQRTLTFSIRLYLTKY